MYSVHQNVQILIALLKKYEIKNIVISAGTRHIPVVFSIEDDSFFNCYSVVDERSAGFFAIGLIEKLKEPVAIICTSGTAAANYVSAVNEAYYQHLPLVVLTSDRNPYYHNQQENQCISQTTLFVGACNKIVDLPIVRDEKDFWYCSRLINEALLELDHREKGPVHINFPIDDNYPVEMGTFKFNVQQLPAINKINRLTLEDDIELWNQKVKELKKSKILVIYGQNRSLTQEENKNLFNFINSYNCVISKDILSNVSGDRIVDTSVISTFLSNEELKSLSPDIVITIYGNSITSLKGRLLSLKGKFRHWHISREGNVSDPFRCMSDIIECSPNYFFKRFAELGLEDSSNRDTYYKQWKNVIDSKLISNPDFSDVEFSSAYIVSEFLRALPQNSKLHIANSNSIRIASYVRIHNKVEVYANRGASGIDGSMSAYVAQSYCSDEPTFLVIGDLSFFYDMNALWNHYITKNTRILMCNNSGGALFHSAYYNNVKDTHNIDRHIAAQHETSAKGWTEEKGFKYISVHNKTEAKSAIEYLLDLEINNPVLVEAFTDKELDIKAINTVLNGYQPQSKRNMMKKASKIPEPLKRTIKSVLKK